MTREHEYEVLKRHDVYVVRKVGVGYYGIAWCDYDGVIRGSYMTDGLPSNQAKEFSWKWRAVLAARSLERGAIRRAKSIALYEARKSATEVRVWR